MNTENQIKYIKDRYLHIPIKVIAKDIGRSATFVLNELKRQNLTIPKHVIEQRKKESRFNKKHRPFNKGKKQVKFMTPEGIENSKKNRFKKGNSPHNTKYDFCISERKDSPGRVYLYIRLELNKWVLLNRYVWELHNGAIPDSHNVQFKDGNQRNCDINNLYLISRKKQAIQNKNTVKSSISMRNRKKSFMEWVLSGSVPAEKHGYETWT